MIHSSPVKERSRWLNSQRLKALVALGVGVLLWFVPTLLLPVLGAPIDSFLHWMRLLAPSAGIFESMFSAAVVLRWVAVALLLAFVLGVERLPLLSVGVRKPRWQDLLSSVGAGLLVTFVGLGLSLLTNASQQSANTQTAQIINTLSVAGKLHLIFQNAIIEELFFRGFLIERVIALTRRPWIGGLVSFVLFVVSHFSGSGIVLTLAGLALPSLVMVLFYLWRRNLFLSMVVHAIGDTVLLFWPS